MTRISFIGGGNMTRSLVTGVLKSGTAPSDIRVAEPRPEVREALTRDTGVAGFADNRQAVQNAAIIVLAVKPALIPTVCQELRQILPHPAPLLISIAAGVRLEQLENWLGPVPFVRCMPNTPALLGAGATGLCANARVSPSQRKLAQGMLDSIGVTCWLDNESLLDVVTGLSGSGPAYFFMLAEAMIEAGVAQGLPRDSAHDLTVQTCLGAGRMLVESGETPGQLRRRVTSPGGTTQAALASLTDHGLPHIVTLAITAAIRRAGELASALDHQAGAP